LISGRSKNSKLSEYFSRSTRKTFRNLFIGFLIWLIGGWPTIVFALPQDGQIVSGSGAISTPTATSMQIDQNTGQMIVNWSSFNIGQTESVNFTQPGADSIALNRVIGADPSLLLGNLTANGQVFITNGSGVFFGPGSKVDTHGLIATTMKISDQDFLDQNYRFTQDMDNPLSSVVNEGNISATSYVGLLAPAVANRGNIIVASLGSVDLAAGTAATLDFTGDGLINFEVTEAVSGTVTDKDGNVLEDRVSNTGLIQADGGQVRMSAKDAGDVIRHVVNMGGMIKANTVVEKDGRVFLTGGPSGIVNVTGTIEASGDDAGEKGGTVHVLGEKVGLFDNAKIDVSGDTGGGTALIGGDYKGGNENIQNASITAVDENVVIDASAGTSGDGGKVIVWADDITRFYGSVFATGGSSGGDGGFVEVSGKQNLTYLGDVDLTAANGVMGTLLLDPSTLTITDSADGSGSLDDELTPGSDNDLLSAVADDGANEVSRGQLEAFGATADIVLEATGQITINDMAGDLINLAATTGSITIRSTTSGGITFADTNDELRTAGGDIILRAQGSGSLSLGLLTTNGGDLTLESASTVVFNGAVNTGAGLLALTAGGNVTQSAALTVGGTASFITNAGNGSITLTDASNAISGDIRLSTNGTGDASLTNTGNTDFGVNASTIGGNLTVVSSLAIGQTSTITAGTSSFTSTGGSIDLTQGGNDLGTSLTLDTNFRINVTTTSTLTDLTITIDPANGSTYALTAGGITGFNLTSSSGNLVVTDFTSSGLNLTLTSDTGDINLADGAISAGAGNVALTSTLGSIVDAADTTNASITTTGNISLTAGTNIGAAATNLDIDVSGSSNLTLDAAGNIIVDSATTLTDLAVTVDPSTNANSTYTITAGGITTFTVTDSALNILVTDITSSGVNISLTSVTGDINLADGAISATAGNVSLTSTVGSIIDTADTANASITTTGNISLTAGTDIGDSGGANTDIDVSGSSNLTLDAAGNIFVDSATALSDLTITINPLTNANSTYTITATNLSTFTLTDNGLNADLGGGRFVEWAFEFKP
jgi:trimeric autotransporter adhesin